MEDVLIDPAAPADCLLLTEDQVRQIVKQQKIAARLGYAERIPLYGNATPEHEALFLWALNNVLATELAVLTFAQIVDDLPVADVAYDRVDECFWPEDGHPLEEHEELCPGAMDKARELRKTWEPSSLVFNPKLVKAYRLVGGGTKEFKTRLIEIVAVAIHQLAVRVFKMKLNLHQGDVDSAVNWVRPEPPNYPGRWFEIPPRPTLFNHVGFFANEIYPEAEADMAGYWAEDRISGGVPVFDRKSEERSTIPPNLYLHACHHGVMRRIFQLRDEQQEALTDFLLAVTPVSPPTPCPLPILGDDQNRAQVDVQEAIMYRRVYRDPWERKPWTRDEVFKFERRPKEAIDYPGMQALADQVNSLPLSAERVQFSKSAKRHGSPPEKTPSKEGKSADAGDGAGGTPDEGAFDSVGRVEMPQHTSASVNEKKDDRFLTGNTGDEAPGSASEQDPTAGEDPRKASRSSAKTEVDAVLLGGEANDS